MLKFNHWRGVFLVAELKVLMLAGSVRSPECYSIPPPSLFLLFCLSVWVSLPFTLSAFLSSYPAHKRSAFQISQDRSEHHVTGNRGCHNTTQLGHNTRQHNTTPPSTLLQHHTCLWTHCHNTTQIFKHTTTTLHVASTTSYNTLPQHHTATHCRTPQANITLASKNETVNERWCGHLKTWHWQSIPSLPRNVSMSFWWRRDEGFCQIMRSTFYSGSRRHAKAIFGLCSFPPLSLLSKSWSWSFSFCLPVRLSVCLPLSSKFVSKMSCYSGRGKRWGCTIPCSMSRPHAVTQTYMQ